MLPTKSQELTVKATYMRLVIDGAAVYFPILDTYTEVTKEGRPTIIVDAGPVKVR